MSPRVLSVVLLAAFACATPLPVQSPHSVSPITAGSNEWRVIDRILVVTDASGTQYANKTFPGAKALTQSFVDAMPDAGIRSRGSSGYAAGLLGFGGEERSGKALAAFNRSGMRQAANALHIMGSVDGMGGGTPLHRVLGEVRTALQSGRGRAAVVIFSDGLADDPIDALRWGHALVGGVPDGVCVHTVQTGNDPAGTKLLTQLADLTACGSSRRGASLSSGQAVGAFARTVFLGSAPAVARKQDPCERRVQLRGVEFAFDRAEIRAGTTASLDAAAQRLLECRSVQVHVEGHTDSRGSEEYNRGLSERRAAAVRAYLVGKGVSANRLTSRGYGESKPIADNGTDAGRARNRRVELNPTR